MNPAPQEAPTLLVVDDDEAWRAALKDSLDAEGFRVIVLARAEWTMSAIELHRPDLVILDNQMPGQFLGLELLPLLCNRWPSLPIIMVSAFGGTLTAGQALRLGAASYLDKPFRIADLVTEIRRVVGARQA